MGGEVGGKKKPWGGTKGVTKGCAFGALVGGKITPWGGTKGVTKGCAFGRLEGEAMKCSPLAWVFFECECEEAC